MTPDLNDVPVLPANAGRLLTALNDSEIDLGRLAGYLDKYPTIVGRLIALANSAWSGAAVPVLDLDAACSRLGLQVIRNTGIALMVASSFDARRCPAFSGEDYWRHAFTTGEFMALYAKRFDTAFCGDELRPIGMLRNVGTLWLAHNMPDETNTALTEWSECGMRGLDEKTERHCGIAVRTASVAVVQKWGLPTVAVTAIRGEHSTAPTKVGPVIDLMDTSEQLSQALMLDDDERLRAAANGTVALDAGEIERARNVANRSAQLASELF